MAVVAAGAQPWVNPRWFPATQVGRGGVGPCDGRGCWGGMQDSGREAGCGRGSGTGVGVASGRDVVEIQALGLPNLLLETDA